MKQKDDATNWLSKQTGKRVLLYVNYSCVGLWSKKTGSTKNEGKQASETGLFFKFPSPALQMKRNEWRADKRFAPN
jgi:hypothetical protein